MSFFVRRRPDCEAAQPAAEAEPNGSSEPVTHGTVEGERSIPSINRARSLQSRVSSALAIGLMSTIGLGLLAWYYSHALTRPSRAEAAAHSAAQSRARSEMALPPLGRIEPPQVVPPEPMSTLLGPKPELPDPAATLAWRRSDALLQSAHPNPPARLTRDLALERRLSGVVFARAAAGTPDVSGANPPDSAPPPAAEGNAGLGDLLQPVVTPAVTAHVLPTRGFLLAKGAFIDCTLETAIDSTLPGMVTCITATDTFGADGRVVLLERGTKLVGESRAQVQQGASRVFVLWTEARTPTGVVVPLASPGTDELGRAGLPGKVDRHFWDRFGAAMLISIINGAVQAAAQSGSGEGTIIINPSVSSDVLTEVLRSTLAIPPTIRKAQGDRIQVLVARDVDFRSVYTLRTASTTVTP